VAVPLGKLPYSFNVLKKTLLPQFMEICDSVPEKVGRSGDCASDLFEQVQINVRGLCEEAFRGELPPRKPPIFLTLGTVCAAPLLIRDIELRTVSSPFDWNVTPLR
jgi:hypothetical protein